MSIAVTSMVDSVRRGVMDLNSTARQIARAVEIMPAMLRELRLANDLKAYEISRSDNAAGVAFVGTMVEQARGEN